MKEQKKLKAKRNEAKEKLGGAAVGDSDDVSSGNEESH